MSPQELNEMIQKIKGLPDNLLVRVLTITSNELLRRTGRTLVELRDQIKKGKHDTGNTKTP